MKVGIFFANLAYRTPDMLEAIARAAEEAGVASVWAEEHPAAPRRWPCPRPSTPT